MRDRKDESKEKLDMVQGIRHGRRDGHKERGWDREREGDMGRGGEGERAGGREQGMEGWWEDGGREAGMAVAEGDGREGGRDGREEGRDRLRVVGEGLREGRTGLTSNELLLLRYST